MGEWFGCSGKRKDWRHTFYFVWNDLKNWFLVVGEGAFSCIFSRHQMEDSADKHEGMCRSRSLSHRVFPHVLLLLLIYFSPTGTWWRSWHWADFLALVQMRSSVMWKRKKNLSKEERGAEGFVCVATTFAVQLLTEWVSDAMSLLLIVPPDELILHLLSRLQLPDLICCRVLS